MLSLHVGSELELEPTLEEVSTQDVVVEPGEKLKDAGMA